MPVYWVLGASDLIDVFLAFVIFLFVTTLSAGALPRFTRFRLAYDEFADINAAEKRLFGIQTSVGAPSPYRWDLQCGGFFMTNRTGVSPRICKGGLSLIGPSDSDCWRCGP